MRTFVDFLIVFFAREQDSDMIKAREKENDVKEITSLFVWLPVCF